MKSGVELLQAYRAAMLALDADALADLYAVDAIHELPFQVPGLPARHEGREAVRRAYRAAWSHSRAVPEEIVEHARYGVDGTTVVVEQEVRGHLSDTGAPFAFPGLLILTMQNGELVRVRDYVDGYALAQAISRGDSPESA